MKILMCRLLSSRKCSFYSMTKHSFITIERIRLTLRLYRTAKTVRLAEGSKTEADTACNLITLKKLCIQCLNLTFRQSE